MSEIYIHYGNLEEAISISQKVRGEITGYVDEIKKWITTPISGLSGRDSSGYASTASSLAWQKINDLNSKSSKFSVFESSVSYLISTAKTKDNYVSGQMETIASMYVQKRNWYQKAGNWIYDTFCVDLANNWDWTRNFTDAAKWVGDKIGNGLENVVDWFKYGDGKYVLNIVTAVVGAIAAIGGAVVAICGIPFTGGATIPIVIGCIGAAAATIGAIITTANSVVSVTQNSKAISKSGNLFDDDDGDPSAARYYGSQTKLSTYYKKTDMGDQNINDKFAVAGETVDTVKVVADVTSLVCSIASLGNVHDYRLKNSNANINVRYNGDKWYKGYSFTYDNIKRNIMHDMGFKISKRKLDFGDAFNIDKSIFAKSYTVPKKFTLRWDTGSWSVNENLVKVFRGTKVVKNVTDISESAVTLNDFFTYRDTAPSIKDIGELAEAGSGLLGNMDFFSPLDKYGAKTGKNIADIFELFAN